MTRVLAVDLGGTNLRAALHSGDLRALQPIAQESAPPGRDAFLRRLGALIEATGADALGIAVPGLAEGTVCRWIPNLPFLDGLDLAGAFPSLSIGLGNDAQIALLAEATAGAAEGMTDAILLAVGTGIGSAVLSGGTIVAGTSGAACSFGWACADLADKGEDRSGWLERAASGRALDRIATGHGLADGSALIAAARQGDTAAVAALQMPANALGTALAGAVALLDPQAVLIAGGLAEALDVLGPAIRDSLQRHLPPHLRGIDLRAGTFGPRAGLVGAAVAGARGGSWRHMR
ncbi:ROK family protein [Mesorhizobium sp. IMUNJ 23232]|uniref:ROK family protein n=1 Tax=Mesorhizobium sp. IMUNJ 23232 TaxID=3376064 RepID=UPI0037AEC494